MLLSSLTEDTKEHRGVPLDGPSVFSAVKKFLPAPDSTLTALLLFE